MYFKDIVGQEDVIGRLVQDARKGIVPHALLLAGPEGTGKLQTAIAFARYLLCAQPGDDACGHGPSCVKMD